MPNQNNQQLPNEIVTNTHERKQRTKITKVKFLNILRLKDLGWNVNAISTSLNLLVQA
jgi:hypothetical protein